MQHCKPTKICHVAGLTTAAVPKLWPTIWAPSPSQELAKKQPGKPNILRASQIFGTEANTNQILG